MAHRLVEIVWKMHLWRERLRGDTRGQDLIEYALMSGLIATAVVALSPSLAASISTQFGRAGNSLVLAAAQGS